MWDTSSMYLKASARPAALGLLPTRRARVALPYRRSPRPPYADGRRAPQVVDKFNDMLVSCYSTAGHTRLLLLHDSRPSEESLRAFFAEVHELYVKARRPGAQQAADAAAASSRADLTSDRAAAGDAQRLSHAHHAHHLHALRRAGARRCEEAPLALSRGCASVSVLGVHTRLRVSRGASLRRAALSLQRFLVRVRVCPHRLVGPARLAAPNLLRLRVVAPQHPSVQLRVVHVVQRRSAVLAVRGRAARPCVSGARHGRASAQRGAA